MPRVINTIIGSGSVGGKFKDNAGAVGENWQHESVQLEASLNDERAAAATTPAAATTAVGGQGSKKSRNRSGSRHSSPGQTDSFNGDDAKWRV